MKPLATSNILNLIFFPISLLLTLSLFTIAGATQLLVGEVLTILLFPVLVVWIWVGVKDARNLYYDEEFVYLEGVIDSSKVPLSQVTRIAKDLTGMRATGVTAWRYRLEFAPSEKVPAQTMYEVDGGKRVAEFVKAVRKINPALAIE